MTLYHLGAGHRRTLRQRLTEPFQRPQPSLLPGQYLLGVDIWEGQGAIDWRALESSGISVAFIRLNDISGGHHMDSAFASHWAAETTILKVAYFVYNPWITGVKNYDTLASFLPPGVHAVMQDVEVVYSGYAPSTYSSEHRKFHDLVRTRWHTAIYTAEWFLPYLSSWPTDSPFWWAQYPNALYVPETITWDRMREELVPYSAPANAAKCPGSIKLWQCSGDKKILPGSPKPMDVNVIYMTQAQLNAFVGVSTPTTPRLLHTIEVYDNGNLVIDGKPYS